MITISMLHQQVRDLDEWELQDWIARRWVRPEEGDSGYGFEDIDVARVRLISVLRHDLQIDPQAVPVVLSLLDQLHDARRQLQQLREVIREVE
jgi:chaperone modulatory protein CbpM